MDLEEERLQQKAAALTLGQAIALYALRVFLNLVVLALIGGTFYGIAVVTQFSQVQNIKIQNKNKISHCNEILRFDLFKSRSQSKKRTGIEGLLLQYLPSIVITTSNFVVPLICDKIALLEKHSPSTTVILALLRLDQHSHAHKITT